MWKRLPLGAAFYLPDTFLLNKRISPLVLNLKKLDQSLITLRVNKFDVLTVSQSIHKKSYTRYALLVTSAYDEASDFSLRDFSLSKDFSEMSIWSLFTLLIFSPLTLLYCWARGGTPPIGQCALLCYTWIKLFTYSIAPGRSESTPTKVTQNAAITPRVTFVPVLSLGFVSCIVVMVSVVVFQLRCHYYQPFLPLLSWSFLKLILPALRNLQFLWKYYIQCSRSLFCFPRVSHLIRWGFCYKSDN